MLISSINISNASKSNKDNVTSSKDAFNPLPLAEIEKRCSNKTTMDSQKCYSDVYNLWDKELNKVYQDLLKITDNQKQKDSLIKSQRECIKHRDLEFKFYDEYYDTRGSIWPQIHLNMKVNFLKSRIKHLYILYRSQMMEGCSQEKAFIEALQ